MPCPPLTNTSRLDKLSASCWCQWEESGLGLGHCAGVRVRCEQGKQGDPATQEVTNLVKKTKEDRERLLTQALGLIFM